MRERKSFKKVISVLAHQAPLTIYALAKKSNVAPSLVHKIVKDPEKGLKTLGIVKAYSEKNWRTGMKSVEYILTFRGLIEYFNLLFEEKRVERFEVKRVIQRYGQFHEYPIFTEHNFLKNWLGDQVYDWICSTAWLLKNHSPHIPIVTEKVSGSLPDIIQIFSRGRIPIPIQWEEEILVHGFTLVFFDLIAVWFEGKEISPTPNSALFKLVEETYEKLRDALERRLKGVKKLEEALEKQFSTQSKTPKER